MNFYKLMSMYDNWQGIVTINDNNLNMIVSGNTYDVVIKQKELHNREVVSFGFYNGEMTVRIK